MDDNNYFIDCFSGAGGFSTGLEMTGKFKCILGIEYDRYAADTFHRNHKHATVFNGDICELTDKKFVELIAGRKIKLMLSGAPCQGFSTAGKGDPEDPRNSLFKQFVRLLKIATPDYFIMENVRGLLSKKNEETFKKILSCFEKLGYNMDYDVLNADDFGVSQARQRLIIIGSRVRKAYMPVIKAIQPKPIVEILKDIKNSYGGVFDHDLNQAEITNKLDKRRIARIPPGEYIRYECQEKEFLTKSLYLDVDWKNMPEGRLRQARYRRLPNYGISPTIMTSHTCYYHPTEDRYLTVREAARIQSFPNDFHFGFNTPMSAKWKQVGNAVPPLMAKAIGEHILFMESAR